MSRSTCLGDEPVDVVQRAELGVNARVVGDVVAPVDVGRRVDRVEPDGRDAEPLQVVELAGQPSEIPDSVTVCVGERPGIHLVEDALAPPRLAHVACNDYRSMSAPGRSVRG